MSLGKAVTHRISSTSSKNTNKVNISYSFIDS